MLNLPPSNVINQAVEALLANADASTQRALTKAQYSLLGGIRIEEVPGGFLVPSFTRATVYRISNVSGCNCAAKGPCKHEACLKILEEAQKHTMPALPRKSRAEIYQEADELWS